MDRLLKTYFPNQKWLYKTIPRYDAYTESITDFFHVAAPDKCLKFKDVVSQQTALIDPTNRQSLITSKIAIFELFLFYYQLLVLLKKCTSPGFNKLSSFGHFILHSAMNNFITRKIITRILKNRLFKNKFILTQNEFYI